MGAKLSQEGVRLGKMTCWKGCRAGAGVGATSLLQPRHLGPRAFPLPAPAPPPRAADVATAAHVTQAAAGKCCPYLGSDLLCRLGLYAATAALCNPALLSWTGVQPVTS